MRFEPALDIKARVEHIVKKLRFSHIKPEQIFCIRSHNSKARAYARIWSLSKVWQKCLGIKPHYIIEVLSQHFDKLPPEAQEKIIIHELLHIPKSFSGAVVAHNTMHFDGTGGHVKRRIDKRTVERLHKLLNAP